MHLLADLVLALVFLAGLAVLLPVALQAVNQGLSIIDLPLLDWRSISMPRGSIRLARG